MCTQAIKPDCKVVRDLLAKKYVVVKNNRQLRDLIEVIFEGIGDASLVVLNLLHIVFLSADCSSNMV
jgi:hypothetical protein